MDTIFALSSGSLPAGLAVVRVSGESAGARLHEMVEALPAAGRLAVREIRLGTDQSILDYGLVVWRPSPDSFTGEDSFELHLHGSPAVISACFDSLSQRGCRLAGAGEFTRRAFDNGKLDLTRVEGLSDLLAAETEAQRRQAVEHSGGVLMRQAETWRAELIDLRAQIEARLDFSDEDDVEPELPDRFRERIGQLLDQLQSALARGAAGEQIRQGFRVVLTGPPNSGKSSLLNALARRDVAIVTDEPGTTRDLVEVSLNLAGTLVRVVDTAGIRGAESEAEQIGIRRARDALQTADLVLRLETGRVGQAGEDFKRPCISLTTKADLVLDREAGHRYVSVRTGEGLDLLISDITAAARAGHSDEPVLLSRERHRTYVQQAHRALTRSCGACDEVAADLLRQASDAIGQLTGRVGVEQVLERLFNEFCIGK